MIASLISRGALVFLAGTTIPAVGYTYIYYVPGQKESSQLDLSTIADKVVVDKKQVIYATNDPTVASFEESNWQDDQKYWVQVLDNNKWVECKIRIIKVANDALSVDKSGKITDTLNTANSVFEITTENTEINWQTDHINIKPKTVETGKNVQVAKLKFLWAKTENGWIGKTKYFIGTAEEEKTLTSSGNLSYCSINQQSCTIKSIHKLDDVEEKQDTDMLGIKLITKNSESISKIEKDKKYLIELDGNDEINFEIGEKVIFNDGDKNGPTFLINLRPSFLTKEGKFYDFVTKDTIQPQKTPITSSEISIYATNTTSVTDFESSTDSNNYFCSIVGENVWSDCTIKAFDSSPNSFTKDFENELKAKDKVFEIKLNKDVGVDWQTKEIKIKPKSVATGKTAKEEKLKMLFFKLGDKYFGKTKYFVGKTTATKSNTSNEGKCRVGNTMYKTCKLYDEVNAVDKDPKFKILSNKLTGSTPLKEIKAQSYLIEISDITEAQKAQEDVAKIDFIFSPPQPPQPSSTTDKQPTFTDIKTAFYDETTKFLFFYTPPQSPPKQ